MRGITLFAAVAVLAGCPPAAPPNPSPPGNPGLTSQFYFPTGLAHVDSTVAGARYV